MEMDTASRVQILEDAVCILHIANTRGKSINPTIIPPSMGRYWGKLNSLTLSWQPVEEKESCQFKPVKLHLKINIVSHPAHAEGLGTYIDISVQECYVIYYLIFILYSIRYTGILCEY